MAGALLALGCTLWPFVAARNGRGAGHIWQMTFRHKNIRLPPVNYVGTGWFFITMCRANRRRLFTTSKTCDWFLNLLRRDAATHSFVIHAYCLMPDHVHLLLRGLDPASNLLAFIKALKTKSSIAHSRETGQPLWQKKFFDHILHRNDSPDAVAWYIWMNPVRAGVCARPEEYPFLGSLTGNWPETHKPPSAWLPPWRKINAPPTVRGRYTPPN